jgi:hypothetical protein
MQYTWLTDTMQLWLAAQWSVIREELSYEVCLFQLAMCDEQD